MPPAGFRRSRALWERVHDNDKYYWVRAVLYELQPVRAHCVTAYRDNAAATFRHGLRTSLRVLPAAARSSVDLIKSITWRQWRWAGGLALYYGFVRWMHHQLAAGPVVLILTALAVIFTVGLSDENDGELSAYSVFNKGFQKLMGSVDEDALLQQHVGGGMMMGGAGMMMMGQAPPEEREEVEPRRRNRQQPQEAARREEDERPAAAAARNNNDVDDENEEEAQPNHNRARRSGKKARRQRDTEQRREMQRQRQAAAALGFGAGEQEEANAMNRLVQDQIVGGGAAAVPLDANE